MIPPARLTVWASMVFTMVLATTPSLCRAAEPAADPAPGPAAPGQGVQPSRDAPGAPREGASPGRLPLGTTRAPASRVDTHLQALDLLQKRGELGGVRLRCAMPPSQNWYLLELLDEAAKFRSEIAKLEARLGEEEGLTPPATKDLLKKIRSKQADLERVDTEIIDIIKWSFRGKVFEKHWEKATSLQTETKSLKAKEMALEQETPRPEKKIAAVREQLAAKRKKLDELVLEIQKSYSGMSPISLGTYIDARGDIPRLPHSRTTEGQNGAGTSRQEE